MCGSRPKSLFDVLMDLLTLVPTWKMRPFDVSDIFILIHLWGTNDILAYDQWYL